MIKDFSIIVKLNNQVHFVCYAKYLKYKNINIPGLFITEIISVGTCVVKALECDKVEMISIVGSCVVDKVEKVVSTLSVSPISSVLIILLVTAVESPLSVCVAITKTILLQNKKTRNTFLKE
jgi:hypothetical protein